MDSVSRKYLLDQQRMAFKANWKKELEEWTEDWDDEVIADIKDLRDANELLWYLYRKISENYYKPEEHIYHNLLNQYEQDKTEIYNYVMKLAMEDQ